MAGPLASTAGPGIQRDSAGVEGTRPGERGVLYNQARDALKAADKEHEQADDAELERDVFVSGNVSEVDQFKNILLGQGSPGGT
jgi:hypothetical protein